MSEEDPSNLLIQDEIERVDRKLESMNLKLESISIDVELIRVLLFKVILKGEWIWRGDLDGLVEEE